VFVETIVIFSELLDEQKVKKKNKQTAFIWNKTKETRKDLKQRNRLREERDFGQGDFRGKVDRFWRHGNNKQCSCFKGLICGVKCGNDVLCFIWC